MLSPIQGVYASAVTPRRLGTQDINLGVMWDLIDYLVSHGIRGIAMLGSTGEFVHFSNSERMRMMGLASKRSRVPIIINVSHSTLDGAVELAQAAQASGAAALLLMPPYFFRYSQAVVEIFYRRFLEEAELEIPLLLYNVPHFTTSPLLHEPAEALLHSGAAQGINDSSGNWDSFEKLRDMRAVKPFTLLIGEDALFSRARAAGADGAISSVACAIPELMTALDRAISSGSSDVVTRLELRVGQFLAHIEKLPVPVGIKEAIAARGLKPGPHAVSPDANMERALTEFREWFLGWLPDVQKECKHV
jgi:dihydrodipicolinate synthase/N-acetylneuraminate lyase